MVSCLLRQSLPCLSLIVSNTLKFKLASRIASRTAPTGAQAGIFMQTNTLLAFTQNKTFLSRKYRGRHTTQHLLCQREGRSSQPPAEYLCLPRRTWLDPHHNDDQSPELCGTPYYLLHHLEHRRAQGLRRRLAPRLSSSRRIAKFVAIPQPRKRTSVAARGVGKDPFTMAQTIEPEAVVSAAGGILAYACWVSTSNNVVQSECAAIMQQRRTTE